MDKSVVLPVGGGYHLKTGKDRIVYAGMPSERVYSIAQRKAMGYQGYAWNLYYPLGRSEITIDGMDIIVENVNADEIRFRLR